MSRQKYLAYYVYIYIYIYTHTHTHIYMYICFYARKLYKLYAKESGENCALNVIIGRSSTVLGKILQTRRIQKKKKKQRKTVSYVYQRIGKKRLHTLNVNTHTFIDACTHTSG
jgi:hypothetical protein